MRNFVKKLKEGTEYLNYGRHIISQWGADLFEQGKPNAKYSILDLGCGPGTDLGNIKQEISERNSEALQHLQLHGVESWAPNVAICKKQSIKTWNKDIEHDVYPGKDNSYDLVLANQVLEHTKEIFWIFSEVGRILKPGGHFIVGVPNIASLHNRLLLLFGQQPTQIQSMSAHVRGFTKPDMRAFAQTGGYFELISFRGSNFYPLPPFLSKPLARLLPNLAWGSFYMLRRTDKPGDFLDCLHGEESFLETPYYGSPQNPAKQPKKISKKKAAKRAVK